jgi:HprK-related kinase A
VKLEGVSPAQFRERAADEGLSLTFGPFRVRLRTPLSPLLDTLRRIYGPLSLHAPTGIHDFHVEVNHPPGLRRWWRRQAIFFLDHEKPFDPFPEDHAFALFEWGLNYAIATRAHRYLMLHSAVVEKEGRALVLPAMPGSGKSTLCAALMLRGWRLFSDEFGILRPEAGVLQPMPRAIPLKNESIEVIRRFAPSAVMGPLFPRTRKGDVVHVAPTPESVERQDEGAFPAWIVFPRFEPGARTKLEPIPGSQAFVRLSNNSFNYHLLGETAYRSLTGMVKGCDCYNFHYSNLEEAIQVMDRLAG